jgi:hypothetical protein
MKTSKKFLTTIAIVMLTISAMAQSNTANDKISGKALIMQAMAVTKQIDLDFGLVAQGSAKTIGFTNNVTGLPNQGTQTTGRFLVSAAATTSVDLAFSTPTNLSDGTHNLPIGTFTYGIAQDNAYATPITATWTTGKTDITFPTNSVESVNGVYVFIGGTVTPATSQPVGSYSADITLTATYN